MSRNMSSVNPAAKLTRQNALTPAKIAAAATPKGHIGPTLKRSLALTPAQIAAAGTKKGGKRSKGTKKRTTAAQRRRQRQRSSLSR